MKWTFIYLLKNTTAPGQIKLNTLDPNTLCVSPICFNRCIFLLARGVPGWQVGEQLTFQGTSVAGAVPQLKLWWHLH